MAWHVNVGGVQLSRPIPDKMIELIKDQLKSATESGTGFWIGIGEDSQEGAQLAYWTPGTVFVITRAEYDPSELDYVFSSRGVSE